MPFNFFVGVGDTIVYPFYGMAKVDLILNPAIDLDYRLDNSHSLGMSLNLLVKYGFSQTKVPILESNTIADLKQEIAVFFGLLTIII